MSMTPRTDSDALLPCPFCGGDAELMADHDNAWANCPECQISLEGFETETDAIAEWNTRADSPELAALRKERDVLKEQVIAYGGPWAVKYAHDRGLPEGHLHPTHYDDLANAGARMDSFTRAALATEGQS